MGRKKVEVNPESGKRLSSLLKDYNMQQKELAKALNYTPQQISRIITGKDRLTEEFAHKVIELFKTGDLETDLLDTVRYEWLMCYDDFKTTGERITSSVEDRSRKTNLIIEIMELHNFHLREVTKTTEILTDENGRQYQKVTFELRSPRGSKVYLSPKELDDMLYSVDDFIDYQCAKRFKKLVDGVQNIYDWSV